MNDKLLEVNDLQTHFFTEDGVIKAVDGVSIVIRENETLGIVGESGSGKSVTALSIMQLLDVRAKILGGDIRFQDESLIGKSRTQMQKIRGNEISMIFQEPMTSLNPVHKVGDQIIEALKNHQKISKRVALHKAVEMLRLVGIPSPEIQVHKFPYQMSGGMRQRVMIAMALACSPKMLIADEPTTALDVTIQAQILDLMRKLKEETKAAVMLITHDLGVIAEMADNVAVLYAGKLVECSSVNDLFENPLHPYTVGLLESIPQLTDEGGEKLFTIEGSIPDMRNLPPGCSFHPRCRFAIDLCSKQEPPISRLGEERQARCWLHHPEKMGLFSLKEGLTVRKSQEKIHITTNDVGGSGEGQEPLLVVENLKKHFPIKGGVFKTTVGHVQAVDNVSFSIDKGETFGLVGESGCGKTTMGRLLLNLLEQTDGTVHFEGKPVFSLNKAEMRAIRKNMQIIFQDPYASLNPRMTVYDIISECYLIHGNEEGLNIRERVAELLQLVGMEANHMRRYPHQFSGGQRQRIGIARAIALNPKFIVCDEPVSALDVSIQAQIINLLEELQEKLGLTYLFIAHDLSVVKHISGKIAVMYLGKIVEMAEKKEFFNNPLHPYSEALLSSVPVPDVKVKRERIFLEGDVPSPSDPPSGCRFHTRCRYIMDICRKEEPGLIDAGKKHFTACHLQNA